jgi:hypothetical protein
MLTTLSAAVAEVSVSGEGKVVVHRMVLALNCGHAVNPNAESGHAAAPPSSMTKTRRLIRSPRLRVAAATVES